MVSLTTWAAMKVAGVIAAPAVTNSGSQMAAIGTLKNARPQAMTRMVKTRSAHLNLRTQELMPNCTMRRCGGFHTRLSIFKTNDVSRKCSLAGAS
jgi:hypothetical protein